jgi:hypothetical protein
VTRFLNSQIKFVFCLFCEGNLLIALQKQALKDLIEIIEMNRGKKVFICTDSLGKEELMIDLAEYFQTLVNGY